VTLTGATLTVNTLAAGVNGTTYTIINSPGGVSGTFTNAPVDGTTVAFGGQFYLVNYTPTTVTLTKVAPITTLSWTGAQSSAWSDPRNWQQLTTPISGDTLRFDTTTVGFAGSAAAFAPNNDIAGLTSMVISIFDNSAAGDFTITGNGFSIQGGGNSSNVPVGTSATINLGANTLSLASLVTLTCSTAAPLIITNALDNAGFGFTVAGSGNVIINGVISGAGALTRSSTGTLTLGNAANTYTGVTQIVGILNVAALANGGVASSIGASSNTAANLVFAGGTLQYTGATAQSTDRLFTMIGSGTIDASGSAAAATVSFTNTGSIVGPGATATLTLTGSNTGANTLTPIIQNGAGTLSVSKAGSGTWVIPAGTIDTYSGATAVSAGTLVVNGSASNSPFNVTSGTLAGTGTINTLAAIGGTVSPGVGGIGTLTLTGGLGGSTLGGATLVVDLSSTGSPDLLQNNANSLTLTGAALQVSATSTSAIGQTFTVLNSGGGLGGTTFSGKPDGTVFVGGNQHNYVIHYVGGSVTLTDAGPTTAYVDDTWLGTTPGTDPANDPVGGLVFGYTAFADIQSGLDAVISGGTLVVFGGTYAAAVNFNKALNPIQVSTNSTVPAETVVTVSGAATVSANTTISLTGAAGGTAADLTFGSTINGAANLGQSLTITGAGNAVAINGAVGNNTPLGLFAITTTGSVTLGSSVAAQEVCVPSSVVIGTINAPGQTVRLQSTGGSVSQQAGSSITAANLAAQANSGITLTQAGNSVSGTFAAQSTTGNIQFTDSAGFTVGTVSAGMCVPSTTGVTASNGNVTSTATGLLTIGSGAGEGITASGAGSIVDLNASGITEGTGSTVSSTNLRLQGTGAFTLGNNNPVATLAANTTGAITFRGGSALSVGTVLGTVGITSNNSDVALSVPFGAITLDAGINAGAGNVGLRGGIGSPLIQTATGTITAAALGAQFANNITLDAVANHVGTFAATDSGFTNFIRFLNAGSFSIGTVPAFGSFSGQTGVSSNRGTITLTSGGSITLDADVSAFMSSAALFIGAGAGSSSSNALTFNAGVIMADSATVTGDVGSDTLVFHTANNVNVALAGAGTLDGFQGSVSGAQTFTFDNINGATGGSVSNTLSAPNQVNTWNVNGVQASTITSGGLTFIYSAFQNLIGGTTQDTFNVAPDPTTPLFIDGNLPVPPTTQGDVLNMLFDGTAGRQFSSTGLGSGVWTFTNRQSVTFQGIESQTAFSSNGIFATGTDAGGGPLVQVYDATTRALKFSFNAYNPAFLGGVRVAVGDVNGDGIPDIITAPGPGGGPLVNVFSGVNLSLLLSFNAYDPSFLGGVFVAAGDVNGDGHADIITAPDAGGGPLVKEFDGSNAKLLVAFNAYDPAFLGGVHIAAGDLNGDGLAEIITAPGFGGGPLVKVFAGGTNTLLLAFNAYDPAFIGGVYVAAGDINGDGKAEIITGANGAPQVNIFNAANGSMLQSYFAFASTFTGGVRVAATDVNGDGKADIVAGAGPGGLPEVRIQDALTLAVLDDFFAYNPLFSGGVFVSG
jgi:autotransporter-associated beta strand protein